MSTENKREAAPRPSYLLPENVLGGADLPIKATYVNSQLVLSLHGMRLAIPPHISEALTQQIIGVLEIRQAPSRADIERFHKIRAEHRAFDGPDIEDQATFPVPRVDENAVEIEPFGPAPQEERIAAAPAIGDQALVGAGAELVASPVA